LLGAAPDLSSGLGAWDFALRELAHVMIFGVLWLTRATQWRRPVLAIVYAASDEVHQTFVRGRHGTPVDVAIDAVGIGLAVLAWTVATRRVTGHAASGGSACRTTTSGMA
jgi:VanZ family protein